METIIKFEIPEEALGAYLNKQVGGFYKILPMREAGESTLPQYIASLQVDILGCYRFFPCLKNEPNFQVLINILQYFKDHNDISIDVTKREVFKAIEICKRLAKKYKGGEGR